MNEAMDWSLTTFSKLADAYHNQASFVPPGSLQATLAARYGAIMSFVDSDRLWPPHAQTKSKFVPFLCEVLSRLPDEDFTRLDDNILSIVLEDPATCRMLAVNVKAPSFPRLEKESGGDTIIFYHDCWRFTGAALVGLIAHEFAHSLVCGQDYQSDEIAADAKAESWGFKSELARLEAEKRILFQAPDRAS